jgi:hypothetical protein
MQFCDTADYKSALRKTHAVRSTSRSGHTAREAGSVPQDGRAAVGAPHTAALQKICAGGKAFSIYYYE